MAVNGEISSSWWNIGTGRCWYIVVGGKFKSSVWELCVQYGGINMCSVGKLSVVVGGFSLPPGGDGSSMIKASIWSVGKYVKQWKYLC